MRKFFLASLIAMLWSVAPLTGQTPTQNDTLPPAKPKVTEPAQAAEGEEFDLDAIEIQAVVEKPNVDIIPKRTTPEWEETRFVDRSFESELKQAPKDLMLVDDELDRALKLEALKKADPPPKEK